MPVRPNALAAALLLIAGCAGCRSAAAPDGSVTLRGVLRLGGCPTLRTPGGRQYEVRDLPPAFQRPPASRDSARVRATGRVREEFTTCMVGPVLYVREIAAE